MIQSLVIGWWLMKDRRALRFCWLYPLRDLQGFGVWVASFLSHTFIGAEKFIDLLGMAESSRRRARRHFAPVVPTETLIQPARSQLSIFQFELWPRQIILLPNIPAIHRPGPENRATAKAKMIESFLDHSEHYC